VTAPVLTWLRQRRDHAVYTLSRLSPGPVLVRLVVFASAAGALALVYGPLSRGAVGTLLVAAVGLLPALLPRTGLTTLVVLACALGWMVTATTDGSPRDLVRLVVLAGLLYLAHTSAALAAVLPYDTVVSPGALGRWGLRAAVVLAMTVAFTGVCVVIAGRADGSTYLIASLAGLGVAVALGALLVHARSAPEAPPGVPPGE
jgi:hypothetical protein